MSARTLRARLARLGPPPVPEDVRLYCVFHGRACEMGKVPPDDLVVLVHEAHVAAGVPVEPLYEHQVATPAQRARREREIRELIEAKRRRNEAEERVLRGEPAGPVEEVASWTR
ncbi:hypothetical protein ACFCX4_08965 [Kitasatospora sp. NPDC056327]|uniref:hypothetical protein n=1 Tax=Kitasatospora sp. NPDC056327 TaxID=3345785 RepID=UPI0035DD72D1